MIAICEAFWIKENSIQKHENFAYVHEFILIDKSMKFLGMTIKCLKLNNVFHCESITLWIAIDWWFMIFLPGFFLFINHLKNSTSIAFSVKSFSLSQKGKSYLNSRMYQKVLCLDFRAALTSSGRASRICAIYMAAN